MPAPSRALTQQFMSHFNNIEAFLRSGLCLDTIETIDILPGTRAIDYYSDKLDTTERFAFLRLDDSLDRTPYEGKLLSIVTNGLVRFIVPVGGLGSGKSTAVNQLLTALASMTTSCNTCQRCCRSPLRVDCNTLAPYTKFEEAYGGVMRGIRHAAFDQILRCWAHRTGHDKVIGSLTDVQHRVLRRLVVVNDLANWAEVTWGAGFTFDLRTPNCTLPKGVLSSPADMTYIETLVANYVAPTDTLSPALARIRSDRQQSATYTAATLGFYLSRCPEVPIWKLLVVDNLDPLPTRTIETIVKDLYAIADAFGDLRCLIPLRPSSISPKRFWRTVGPLLHYGPSHFDVVRRRIERFVLRRSRSQLESIEDSSSTALTVFAKTPSDIEMQALLYSSYLYARIMAAGAWIIDGQKRTVDLHADHAWLGKCALDDSALGRVACILDAVTGTCVRYSLTHAYRYFQNMYYHPVVFGRLAERERLTVPYKLLLDALILERTGPETKEGIVNLLAAETSTRHNHMPSLAKLRILLLLQREKKIRVSVLLERLAYYGIPEDVTIEALNALHRKDNILVWFSDNEDLDVEHLSVNEYVTVSEHGLGYLDYLIGSFEYLWVCGARMGRVDVHTWNYSDRLDLYSRCLKSIRDVEWLQFTTCRILSGRASMETGIGDGRELITMRLLIQSVADVVDSACAAIGTARRPSEHSPAERAQYIERIQQGVAMLFREVIDCERRYEVAFGRDEWRRTYRESLVKAVGSIEGCKGSDDLSAENKRELHRLVERWRRQPKSDDGEWSVTQLARSMPSSAGVREAGSEWERAYRLCVDGLMDLVCEHVPAFDVLRDQLGFVREKANEWSEAIDAGRVEREPGRDLRAELAWLDGVCTELEQVSQSIAKGGSPRKPDVDGVKKAVNVVIDVARKVGVRYKQIDPPHLRTKWSYQ